MSFHCLLDSLQNNLDGHHRTCRESHRCALAQAKIVTVDCSFSAKTCACPFHRTLTPVVDIESDWPGHPMQDQVPSHSVVLTSDRLDVCTRKGDRGIFLHVKESSGTQVCIA